MSSPRETVRAIVLAGWAALFVWLWRTGEAATYIGPRSAWIVPFGAIGLAACALGAVLSAWRPARAEPLSRREGIGHLGLTAPIIALVLVPHPHLGARAAANKAAAIGIDTHVKVPADPAAPLDLTQLVVANSDAGVRAQLDLKAQRAVVLDGLVTGAKPGVVQITRFRIWCCAADAIPYTVAVRLPAGAAVPKLGTWLGVRGSTVADRPDHYAVAATWTAPRAIPEHGYA